MFSNEAGVCVCFCVAFWSQPWAAADIASQYTRMPHMDFAFRQEFYEYYWTKTYFINAFTKACALVIAWGMGAAERGSIKHKSAVFSGASCQSQLPLSPLTHTRRLALARKLWRVFLCQVSNVWTRLHTAFTCKIINMYEESCRVLSLLWLKIMTYVALFTYSIILVALL